MACYDPKTIAKGNAHADARNGLVAFRQIAFDSYPSQAPFDPAVNYPELVCAYHSEINDVYEAVRNVLNDMGLDRDHFNCSDWNPFKGFIKPGDEVVIKPNLVLDADQQEAVTTHASVIRPLIDYAWKALDGRGSIAICDAPVIFADFDNLTKKNGLRDMVQALRLRGYNLELIDLRSRKVKTVNNVAMKELIDLDKLRCAVIVDLQEASLFADANVKQNKLAYGAYNGNQIKQNHNSNRHCYSIAKLILEADAVICVPKLKTHKKAGITCCLKNLVGINVDKNYLPHFTSGPANCGGDEFPRLPSWRLPLLQLFKLARLILLGFFGRYTAQIISSCVGILNKFRFKVEAESPTGKIDAAQKIYQLVTGTDYGGSWNGNDTVWRMILDLNRIFLFADAQGKMGNEKKRNVFYLVDSFIAGEKNGPLTPHVTKPGIVVSGFNAALVDKAILQLAGIDSSRIPLYREAFSKKAEWLHDNQEMKIRLNGKQLEGVNPMPIMKLLEPSRWNYSRN